MKQIQGWCTFPQSRNHVCVLSCVRRHPLFSIPTLSDYPEDSFNHYHLRTFPFNESLARLWCQGPHWASPPGGPTDTSKSRRVDVNTPPLSLLSVNNSTIWRASCHLYSLFHSIPNRAPHPSILRDLLSPISLSFSFTPTLSKPSSCPL